MKKLRMGVIGVGMISGGHLSVYQTYERTELIAIADIDAEWLEYQKNAYNVKYAYTDYHELLANPEVDAVSICLPTYLHAQASIDALNAGKHVLCEKPMACTAEEARAMRAAELKSGKKLMISHNQRFGPDVQAIKQLVEAGELGDVYFIRLAWRRPLGVMPTPYEKRGNGAIYNRNWFNEKDKGGGVLRDLGSHLLDLTMFFMDFPEFESASANAYRKFKPEGKDLDKYVFDSEDLACGHLKFKNGLSIQLEVSFGSMIQGEELLTEVYGTKMGILRNHGTLRLTRDRDYGYTSETVTKFKSEFRMPMYYFVDSILDDTPIPIPSDEGIKVIEILDAIYESAGEIK